MKTIIVAPLLLILLLSASCKKQRTCTCSSSSTKVRTYPNGATQTFISSGSTSVKAEKQTKKYFRMDNNCYSSTIKDIANYGSYVEETTIVTDCDLK